MFLVNGLQSLGQGTNGDSLPPGIILHWHRRSCSWLTKLRQRRRSQRRWRPCRRKDCPAWRWWVIWAQRLRAWRGMLLAWCFRHRRWWLLDWRGVLLGRRSLQRIPRILKLGCATCHPISSALRRSLQWNPRILKLFSLASPISRRKNCCSCCCCPVPITCRAAAGPFSCRAPAGAKSIVDY